MFFTDNDGAQAVLFGQDKKIVLANFAIPPKGDPDYVGLIIGSIDEGDIVDMQGKSTKDFNPKIRIVFQTIEDVDLLIDNLKAIKKALGNTEIDNILKPGKN